LSYSLQLLLYRIAFDEIVDEEPLWAYDAITWDDEFVRQHQVQGTVSLDAAGSHSLQLTAALPPQTEQYGARLNLGFIPVSLSLGSGVRREEPDGEWLVDPFTANATIEPWEEIRLANSLSYDVEADELSVNRTTLTAGPASAQFELRTAEGYTFGGTGVGWEPDGQVSLRPTQASFGLSLDSDMEPLWHNRVLIDAGADLSWQSSLTRFTESSLRFSFSGSVVIHEFLRFSLQTSSLNSQSYVYVPDLARTVGREPRNILVDLARSFNFFSRADRLASGFNLQSIQLNAVHDLGDWDLTVGYRGQPEIVETEDSRAYEWRGTLDVKLQWRPIKELTTSITVDPDEISFEGDS
jgi:hypothetical protein